MLASILQIIGQLKQIQLDDRTSSDMDNLLKQADSTLGEQFASNLVSVLSDASVAEATSSRGIKVGDRNEQVGPSLTTILISIDPVPLVDPCWPHVLH